MSLLTLDAHSSKVKFESTIGGVATIRIFFFFAGWWEWDI